MRLYHLSVRMLVFRFYLIMGIIVASGFGAYYFGSAFWYLSLLAFPVFLSCLLGIDFGKSRFLEKLEFWHHHNVHAQQNRRLVH